jgi:hypothetical protein
MVRLAVMRRDRKRMTKAVAIVMLVAMVALLGASFTVSRSTTSTTTTLASPSSTAPSTTSTTIDPALLSAPAKELEALAAKGRAGRFHVRFEVTGDAFASDVASAVVEVWRADGRFRQDASQTSTAGLSSSQLFAGPDGDTQCVTQAGSPISCTDVTAVPGATDDLVSGIEVLVNTGSSVTARDDTALGAPARCFDVGAATPENSGTVCFTAAGVPVGLVTPHFTLTVSTVDDAIDATTFAVPAHE